VVLVRTTLARRCRQDVAAPPTSCGSIAVEMAMTAERPRCPRRPRNASAPSSRPTHKRGLNGDRSPVRTSCGEGAAHLEGAPRWPQARASERVSHQWRRAPGSWPTRACAFTAAGHQWGLERCSQAHPLVVQ
jgi:hypothetical protein